MIYKSVNQHFIFLKHTKNSKPHSHIASRFQYQIPPDGMDIKHVTSNFILYHSSQKRNSCFQLFRIKCLILQMKNHLSMYYQSTQKATIILL